MQEPACCEHGSVCPVFLDHFRQILATMEHIVALIERKIPDPPLQLVHTKEVCLYVGIVSKTLYRCEKLGMIQSVKRDHTGKYFLRSDMVSFKKKYHYIVDI